MPCSRAALKVSKGTGPGASPRRSERKRSSRKLVTMSNPVMRVGIQGLRLPG